MLHQITIYFRLLRVQLRSQIQYRWSFILQLVGTGLIGVLEFGALALVLQRFDSIQGWTVGEVAFLFGSVEIAFATMDMIFSGFDPKDFGMNVRMGTFDQVLLRPIPVTLQVLGSDLALRRIGRIVTGFGILAYALSDLTIVWTGFKIDLLVVTLVSMFFYFGALFIIGATIAFWTVESIEAMNILTYGGSYIISHPMHIYQRWIRSLFTFVIPAIFLNYYPALYILGKTDPQGMPTWAPFVSPLIAAGALLLAMAFWRFGIRNYQSTGS